MAQPYAQLGRGLGTAIGSFFGGNPQAQAAGEMAGLQRVALEDQIGQRRAKAAAEAQQAQMVTPDASRDRVMAALGIPQDALPDLQQWRQSGRLPAYETLPEGEAGPVAARPQYLSDDNLGKFGKFFAADQAVLSGAAKSLKDFMESGGALAQSGLTEQIASGAMTPQMGGARVAAIEGKPLYNFNEFGTGDNFAGTVDVNNPAAKNFAQYRGAQTAAQKANAVQSYASADASRASAAKTRADAAQGARTGNVQIVTDAAGRVMLVDKTTGQARPAIGPDGSPVGAALKPAKAMTEAQGKAMLFGSRMQESSRLLDALEEKGVMTPSLTKMAVEQVPLVGGALGMAANAFVASPEQQQVEQAQRDFVNAVLRRESGAVISDTEFANAAKQYFPQPGDDPSTRAQKKRNRELAIRGLMAEAGPNAPNIQAPAQEQASGGWSIQRVD